MSEPYLKNIEKYRELRQHAFYPFVIQVSRNGIYEQKEIDALKEELKDLKSKVEKTPKEIVEDFQLNLTSAIDFLLKKLEGNVFGTPLSKNQGLIIPNAVYVRCRILLRNVVMRGYFGSTQFLYSSIIEDQLDPKPLKKILVKWKGKIQTRQYSDYLEFETDAEEMFDEIINLMNSEK